ncbi:hypothetical protein FA95DRAFT_914798 [Auriscalpium vulgare]|uniref:Uncharacterized protein n=1 Tax=Auriscalpium vulgare TaxID=40419 RepID=A0ACB8R8R4_9AGAM|nr:hypothetical protein FA95DRAFT_914798 [Auriscalpium vulgare]
MIIYILMRSYRARAEIWGAVGGPEEPWRYGRGADRTSDRVGWSVRAWASGRGDSPRTRDVEGWIGLGRGRGRATMRLVDGCEEESAILLGHCHRGVPRVESAFGSRSGRSDRRLAVYIEVVYVTVVRAGSASRSGARCRAKLQDRKYRGMILG